jgi:hypothetical protein
MLILYPTKFPEGLGDGTRDVHKRFYEVELTEQQGAA